MTMMNILVPIGGAKNTVSNLQYAIDLAEYMGATVHLVAALHDLTKVGTSTRLGVFLEQESKERIDKVLSEVDKKQVSIVIQPVGKKTLESAKTVDKETPIDLMVLSPRTNSIKDDVYLGETSGKLLKRTNIPILVVPEGTQFEKPKTMLMAFKNGRFEDDTVLKPIRQFKENFNTEVHILHVNTPETTKKMKDVSDNLKELAASYTPSEASTTHQGVVEHFQHFDPDMLCVIRRKRGFFKKMWEKNEINKREFDTHKPLLVLSVQD